MEYVTQDGQKKAIPEKDYKIWDIVNKKNTCLFRLEMDREKTGCTGLLCFFQTENSVIH